VRARDRHGGNGHPSASAVIWIVVASLVYEIDARAVRGEARDR
jgi:hypothetical protein